MPNITDPEIWDKLSTKGKVKYLSMIADLAESRCSTCLKYSCECNSEAGEPNGF